MDESTLDIIFNSVNFLISVFEIKSLSALSTYGEKITTEEFAFFIYLTHFDICLLQKKYFVSIGI